MEGAGWRDGWGGCSMSGLQGRFLAVRFRFAAFLQIVGQLLRRICFLNFAARGIAGACIKLHVNANGRTRLNDPMRKRRCRNIEGLKNFLYFVAELLTNRLSLL